MKKEAAPQEKVLTEQLVVFSLGEQYYGVSIFSVQEIIRIDHLTPVPRTPSFVQGIINLRGKIIPVIDLKKRFNCSREMAATGEERIIVIEAQGTVMGMMVDQVTEVISVPRSQLGVPLQIGEGKVAGLLKAVIPRGDGMIMLLDMEKVFCSLQKEQKDNIA